MLPNHNADDKIASTKKHVVITAKELPLSCPGRDMQVWNSHPRVYLPLDETGYIRCPYCGTEYVLKDFSKQNLTHKKISENPITE